MDNQIILDLVKGVPHWIKLEGTTSLEIGICFDAERKTLSKEMEKQFDEWHEDTEPVSWSLEQIQALFQQRSCKKIGVFYGEEYVRVESLTVEEFTKLILGFSYIVEILKFNCIIFIP